MGRGRGRGTERRDNPRVILLGKKKPRLSLNRADKVVHPIDQENNRHDLLKSVLPSSFSMTYSYSVELGKTQAEVVARTCENYRANYYLEGARPKQQELFDLFLESIVYRIYRSKRIYANTNNITFSREEGYLLSRVLPYIWSNKTSAELGLKEIANLKRVQKILVEKFGRQFHDDADLKEGSSQFKERKQLISSITSADIFF